MTGSPAPVSIGDLVPDFDAFLRDDYDKRPALFRGAMSHRPERLPSSRTIDELTQSSLFPSAYVRLARGGEPLHHRAYTYMSEGGPHTPMLDAAKVVKAFSAGATIALNDVQEFWPGARELLAPLAEAFLSRTEAVLFATPAGRSGFSPHSDPLGVFVLQGEGVKDWRVWPTRFDGDRGSVTFTAEELGEPVLEATLEPGDVLYLPHGAPHAAAATHRQSVHISLGVWPRTWAQIMTSLVSDVVDGSTAVAPFTPGDDAMADMLAGQVSSLAQQLQTLDVHAALTDLHEQFSREAPQTRGIREMAQLDELTSDCQLTVDDNAEVAIVERGDPRTTVTLNGVTVVLPTVVVDRIEQSRTRGGTVSPGALYPGVAPARAVSVARQLSRIGMLRPAPGEGVAP